MQNRKNQLKEDKEEEDPKLACNSLASTFIRGYEPYKPKSCLAMPAPTAEEQKKFWQSVKEQCSYTLTFAYSLK